jgi:hypothetical protein
MVVDEYSECREVGRIAAIRLPPVPPWTWTLTSNDDDSTA